MISKKVSAFFSSLFLLSIPATFIFWTFFSDSRGFSEEDERRIAAVINENYREGDLIFPSPEWDVGFTRFIRDGITDISYTLNSYGPGELGDLLTNPENSFLFILDNREDWDSIRSFHRLKEQKSFPAGESIVVKAIPETGVDLRLVDFFKDISKAESVYLEDSKGQRSDCVLKGDRWMCSSHSWNYVGQRGALMGGRRQNAVWAHPRSRKTLNVRFAVPEKTSTLVLGTAFLERAYHAKGDPVKVRVSADGNEMLSYVNENTNKYYRNRISVPSGTKYIQLSFYVRNDGARHFVFNGYLSGN